MESKVYYVAVYGKHQVPFASIEQMKKYFEEGDNLFDAIMQDVKTYKLTVEQFKLKDYA